MSKLKFLFLFFCLLFSHFCFSASWKRIYLSSYPQSGNHWVRHSVEDCCRIATSSVYRDFEPPGHMNRVFPWGGYCCDHGYRGDCRYPNKGEIVLLKTHYPYPGKNSPYDRQPNEMSIHIIRNPVDTFYSRYVKLPKGPLESKIPSNRVRELVNSWRMYQNYWKKQKNTLTIRYEDLLQDPAEGVRKICHALQYEFSEEDIERAVAMNPPEGFEFKHLDKFRKKDLEYISKQLHDLLEEYGYTIPL